MNNKSIEILKSEKSVLAERFGVDELAVFGSVARGDDRPESDIDILVSLKIKTLHNYISLVEYLQQLLNRKVDLVTKHKHLSQRFLNAIKNEVIYV